MHKIKTTSEVPSAKEFYDAHYSDDAVVMLRDFARLHVKAALEAAAENADLLADGERTYINRYIVSDGNHYSETEIDINKNSILLAYPETNIK